MRFVLAAMTAFFFVMSASPAAHRLDEYLQAARLSFGRTGVALELDLTPGASVATGVIALIDRDADGRISPLEAESYGRVVLTDVVLELDGRAVPMTLVHIEVPSLDELRYGIGAIQLRAIGTVEHGSSRRPQLHFRNNHQPGSSAYLVNALMPDDADVSVVGQTRDARQQDVRIDYLLGSTWPTHLYWPVLGVAALFLVLRRSRAPLPTTNH